MLRNKTVPVAKMVTARVTLYITVRDVKKRAMKAPTAATDINIPKTAALAVADVRSVVYAVSPVAVIADIIPAFTLSTTYFSRSLFKASVPRSQLPILSRRDHITYGLWGFKVCTHVIICVGWQIRIKFSPASGAQDCSSCQIMSSAIASLRMENGTKDQFDPQQKRNAPSGSAQRMRLSYYGVIASFQTDSYY